MLPRETIIKIADDLAQAERDRRMIPRLTAQYPDMTIEDSYAVQSEWRRRGEAAGRRLVGRKIGLTSKVMQMAVGIDEPDYGAIFEDMVYENGAVIRHDAFTNVRIEVELAFVLKEDLRGPNVTMFEVMRATEYVIPALEILATRLEMEGRTIVDNIADNAAMGAMIYGGNPTKPHDVESGVAAAILNHPATSVAWLANKLAEHSDSLSARDIILAGSFTRPMWVEPGDSILCDFGPLGTISCRFQ